MTERILFFVTHYIMPEMEICQYQDVEMILLFLSSLMALFNINTFFIFITKYTHILQNLCINLWTDNNIHQSLI
jgi:hypothetical protein